MKRIAAAIVGALMLGLTASPAAAVDSAVIFMYSRFDDSRFPSANTRLDQLESHIAELKTGGYAVWPVMRIIEALRAGRALPERTVGITIDDAWNTVYSRAWPILRAAGFPFTVFVVADETDRGGEDYMTWAQLREMAAGGLVDIGSQGAGHQHLTALSANAAAEDLARAGERFRTELGEAPKIFAWPYGEMSRAAEKIVRDAGYTAAFGQHSGAAWSGGDFMFLPRFALNETYGQVERFRLAARTLALPVIDITPDDPKITENPPNFGFTFAETVPGAELLACYASHEGRILTEQLGPRVEVRMMKPFPQGRGRINCTIPTLDGRWRWFGRQFTVE